MENFARKSDIPRKVFEFYAKNKKLCDSNFMITEDESIDNIYDDVSDENSENILLTRTSIVLLTANKYERNILHERVYGLSGKKINRIEIELFTACQRFKKIYAYWFEWNGYSVLNVHANVTGSYTIGGSADIIRWILLNEYLFPKIILSFGICFGTKGGLGDVVISRKIYPYFIGAKINGENLSVVDDNAFSINDDLYNKINNLKNNNKFKKFAFKVYFQNYITGEAVVSSEFFRQKFVGITTQDIFAGDMEGYGLFKECTSYPYNVPCIIIKSICDWGIEKNFDVNDEELVSAFRTSLSDNNISVNSNEEVIKLLDTLKDRLQAYSANCAFDVLEVILQNNILGLSILDDFRIWINNRRGVATSCRKVREKIFEHVKSSGLGFVVPDCFVHQCIEILEKEEVICRESHCDLDQNRKNKCSTSEIDVSIGIGKWEGKENA